MKTSDKSNSINVNTGAQPSNNGRRKVLSYSVGLAASASLGGIGLLMPGVAQAEDISTTKTCSSLANEDGGNIPKLQLIYQSIPKSVEENCWAVNSVFRSNAVFYDSKARKAYAGVITQITRRDGWADPRTVTTRSWTLKSSASLLNINGEWTSNYYDEKGTRLLRLTKDELLNPLTHHKAWSHTKETSGSSHDEYRRRLADNPPTHVSWTQDQVNARLIAELKRVFVEWFQRLRSAGRYDIRAAGAPRAFRLDTGVADINIYVQDVLRSVQVGNEPFTYLQVDVETVRGYGYRMFMVRNIRAPNVIEYRVLVVDMENLWGDPHIQNPAPRGERSGFTGPTRTGIDDILRRMNQFTSSQSERMALFTGATELVDHVLVPPVAERFSMMPFDLINAYIGFGSLPNLVSGVTSELRLPPEIINDVASFTLDLHLSERLRNMMNAIDLDVANGFPWMTFRFNDEDARHRRLIGYTQDKVYPQKPVIVPITGECRLCPSDDDLTNDAW